MTTGVPAEYEINDMETIQPEFNTTKTRSSTMIAEVCTKVASACVHLSNESVQTKLYLGAGTWVNYSSAEMHRRFTGFDYDAVFGNDTLVSTNYWCTSPRALRMRNRMWFPHGCMSLSEDRFNLTVLPPGIRVMEFGNSYMGQQVQSLCARAAAKREVAMIESITNPNTDLLLADMEKNGSVDWTNYAEYRAWCIGDPLPTHTEARAYDRYVMTNGATLVYAHNKQSLGLPEELTIELMLNMSGWSDVTKVDVIFVSRGNSVD